MDLSRLDILYCAVWLIAFCATALIKMPTTADVTVQLYWLVFGTMGSFVIIAAVGRASLPKGQAAAPIKISAADAAVLNSFVRLLFCIWVPGFLFTVVYSGGVPLLWRLIGDPRTYLDFGAPSISGLLNMLRAFIFAALVYEIMYRRARRIEWLMFAVVLGSAVSEMSRGALTVLMFYGVGCYLLLRRVSAGSLFKLGLLAVVFVLGFGFIGQMRTIDYELDLDAVLGRETPLQGVPMGLVWVYLYIATPLNNLAAALAQGLEPSMLPHFTLQPLLPTVIRSQLFDATEYPVDLPIEAFNATTFFAPLVSDFGVSGAFIFTVGVQISAVYVHMRARTGSLMAIMMYPTVFTAIALSVFYIYFLSLPFVLYPLLTLWFDRYRRRKLAAMAAGEIHLQKIA